MLFTCPSCDLAAVSYGGMKLTLTLKSRARRLYEGFIEIAELVILGLAAIFLEEADL